MNQNSGTKKGEMCNRNGCTGIIEEGEKEGCCSCHINPPCSYCTTQTEYCPVCGWSAEDEQNEYLKEYAKKQTSNRNKITGARQISCSTRYLYIRKVSPF